jgi:hypothetical protein
MNTPMAQVNLLPIHDFSPLEHLFDPAFNAEGTVAWFQTLADTTLRPQDECVLAVAKDNGGAVRAALPLIRDKNDELRALTSPYTTLYTPPLSGLEWARYLGVNAPAFVANVLRLDALDLDNPAMSAFLDGLATSSLAHVTFVHFPNWFETIEDFGLYWSTRPSRLRSTVRRKLASIQKNHQLEFGFATTETEIESALQEYLDVYGSSWKPAEPHPNFVCAMVKNLGTFRLNGSVIAAQIWLLKDGKATIFKLAHREGFTGLSPGTLLTHWMLKTVCRKENVQEFDFGRGDDAYKREWLSNVRLRHGLIAANRKSRKGLVTILREIYPTRIVAMLKTRPTVQKDAVLR